TRATSKITNVAKRFVIEAATAPCSNRPVAGSQACTVDSVLSNRTSHSEVATPKRSACRTNLFGILGTAHAQQHRIAFDREARFQTTAAFRKEGTDQKPRSISADVSRVDQSAL